jgi:excisionase family DNA binding protein
MRTREAAAYLGVGESTMEKWRITGQGPAFERAGTRIVVYRVEDLDAFLGNRRDDR